MIAKCQECDADIKIPDDAIVGEIIECKECSSEYEVAEIGKAGAKLKAAEVAEEDWGE
jgi:alpha-aminoadipate/glutamate carrier protein LysW